MPVPSEADRFDFVMGYVSHSKQYKSQFIDKWQEVIANFVVEPMGYSSFSVKEPYGRGQRREAYGHSRGIVLKDGETHKAVMTWASKMALSILGDRKREYVRATPSGFEDAIKASTVTRLLRYNFGLQGNFIAMVKAIVDMILFGTSVVEIKWKYREREMPVRTVESFDGIETETVSRQRVTAFDDPVIVPIDNADFFPDPSQSCIEDMVGVAKRMRVNAMQARSNVSALKWNSAAVERAIKLSGQVASAGRGSPYANSLDENFREGYDQPEWRSQHPDFTPMIAFRYSGDVPWEDDEGSSRRMMTVLNGHLVEDKPYDLADPELEYRAFTINPVTGRFYGVSPAEVIRWDQDLQDAMKILMAEAVIRQVHPPIAYNADMDINESKLRRWSPDVPIAVSGGPANIGTVRYDAGVFSGFAQNDRLKLAMQETSGALGALQGQEGPDREAATVGQYRYQAAASRPELAAVIIESETMPGIAKSILRRYQQFATSEDLIARIGERPESVWIGDIMGDFDIQFVGSRMAMSRAQKLQAFDRLTAMSGAIPEVAAIMPWLDILPELIGDTMELPEVAAKIGDPQQVQMNIMLNMLRQAGRGAGNGNNVPQQGEPAGMLPAQAGGGELG